MPICPKQGDPEGKEDGPGMGGARSSISDKRCGDVIHK